MTYSGKPVYPPRKKVRVAHKHTLAKDAPFPSESNFPRGTALQCFGCRKWFMIAPDVMFSGVLLLEWKPVRWWHFRVQRRIAEHVRMQRVADRSKC